MTRLAVPIICLVGASLVMGEPATQEDIDLLKKVDSTMNGLIEQVEGLKDLDLIVKLRDREFDETAGSADRLKGKVSDVLVRIPKGSDRNITASHHYVDGDENKVKQEFSLDFGELILTGQYAIHEGSALSGAAIKGTSNFEVVVKDLHVSGEADIDGETGKYTAVNELSYKLTDIQISLHGGPTIYGGDEYIGDLNGLLGDNKAAAYMIDKKDVINEACKKHIPSLINQLIPENIKEIITLGKKASREDLENLMTEVTNLGKRLSKVKVSAEDVNAYYGILPNINEDIMKQVADRVLALLKNIATLNDELKEVQTWNQLISYFFSPSPK